MKSLFNLILCAAIAFLVSGCWPYGGGGGGGTSYYYTLNNPAEADSATGFTKSNTTFRIVAPALQAPMIQKKGQVKIFFDAGNSVSGALAVGVGKRSFLLAGISGGTTDWNESDQLYLDLEYVTSSNPNGTPTDVSGYYPYERKTHASALTAEFAYGQYRQWGKKFRYEWFGGLGYGRYENSHEVVMENQLYYFNTDQFESQFSDNRRVLNFLFQNNVAWVTDYSELIVMGRLNSFMFASRETEMHGQTDVPGYSPWAFAFEPGVRFALGGKRLKLYVHYETVIPVKTDGVDWLKSQWRGGVVFRL